MELDLVPVFTAAQPRARRGPAVGLPSAGYVLVARIKRAQIVANSRPYARLRGIVGSAGPLTSLKLSRRVTSDGVELDWYVDGALDTPTIEIPAISKSSPGTPMYLCPALGTFELLINMDGLAEVSLYARGASNTTLTVEGGA